jgi:hypothetical protein
VALPLYPQKKKRYRRIERVGWGQRTQSIFFSVVFTTPPHHHGRVGLIPVISVLLILTNTYHGCRLAYPFGWRGFVRTKKKKTEDFFVWIPRWMRLVHHQSSSDAMATIAEQSNPRHSYRDLLYMSRRSVLSKQHFAKTHVHQSNKSSILGNMANMTSERVVQFGTLKFLLFTNCSTRLTIECSAARRRKD